MGSEVGIKCTFSLQIQMMDHRLERYIDCYGTLENVAKVLLTERDYTLADCELVYVVKTWTKYE